MLYRLFYFLFKKQIDFLAQEKLKDLALEEYINTNLFLANGDKSPEMQFQGKQLIKYMAASMYDIVKEADNYVVMDLNSEGYEPLTITIQKRWKLSPHDRANKLQKENEELKSRLKESEIVKDKVVRCVVCGKESLAAEHGRWVNYYVGCAECINTSVDYSKLQEWRKKNDAEV